MRSWSIWPPGTNWHSKKVAKDAERDQNLLLLGIKTTRITNAEVERDPAEALTLAFRRASMPTDRSLLLAAQGPMHLPHFQRPPKPRLASKSRKGEKL